jgi:peptidoglycan/xylan/chitin deacetylase (PgdA/CDA1 family)
MLLLALPFGAAAGKSKYLPLPEAFKVTEKLKKTTQKNGSYIVAFYPTTLSGKVNKELEGIIKGYIDQIAPGLPQGKGRAEKSSRLDVMSIYAPTGSSWLSFLILARTTYHHQQRTIDFATRTYDALTGRQILLTDIFPADSPAWKVLSDAVAAQLNAYFPQETAGQSAIQALCSREALEKAAFTLGTVKLQLHYPAGLLYPGHSTMMHVTVYYQDLKGMMTEEAARQTDNSHYQMVALTFDDGPRRAGTADVLDQLQMHGAQATFFLIGDQMEKNRDMVQREHDEGHTVASHTYNHYQPSNLNSKIIFEHKARFDKLFTDMIGVPAPYMRAPGGKYEIYVRNKIGLPIIQWSFIGHDSPTGTPVTFAREVSGSVKDGDIVLMHDTQDTIVKGVGSLLIRLFERDFLCVSVDDLFVAKGLELKENVLYLDANGHTEN